LLAGGPGCDVVRLLVLAQQRALMCGAISLSRIRDVRFGWVDQAAGGAVAVGGLLLVMSPGWTRDCLTGIRARLPGRVRDADPDRDTPEHRDPPAFRQHRRSDPPHGRLDALGRVQGRLMSGLVREKVRRAAGQPPRG